MATAQCSTTIGEIEVGAIEDSVESERDQCRVRMAGLVFVEAVEGAPPPEPSAGPAAAELISQGAEGVRDGATCCTAAPP